MMERFRAWFDGLQPRERTIVLAGAAMVAGTVLFLLVEPLYKATERARERVAEKQMDLLAMERARGEVQALGGAQSNASAGQPLVVVIDRSSNSARLSPYLKRNQPDGDSAIRVTFEGAPFDGLIDFLVDLQTRHGLALSNATLNKGQAEGTVNASLTLVRTSG